MISDAADALGVPASELVSGVSKRRAETKALRTENTDLRRRVALGRSGELAATARRGVVVARVDDMDRSGLRELAVSIRDRDGVNAVVLGTAIQTGGAALVAAVVPGGGFDAGQLIAEAKKTIGGGGRPAADFSMAGGRDASRLDEALDQARSAAGIA